GSTTVSVGSGPNSVAIGDFNRDGKQDLAVANSGSNTVSVRLGDGLGGFSDSTNLVIGSGPTSVAIGDFNGDGEQDLAVTNCCSPVSIRLGRCIPVPTPTPTATGPPLPPTLGNYPDTSMPLSGDTTVTPDAAPTNTTSITVSTSTNFKGRLEG